MAYRWNLSLIFALFIVFISACSSQGAFMPVSCDGPQDCPQGSSCIDGLCELDLDDRDASGWDISDGDTNELPPQDETGEDHDADSGHDADDSGHNADSEDDIDSGEDVQDPPEPLECSDDKEPCGDECIDLDNDGLHCGQCDRNCSEMPYATGLCIEGVCEFDCGDELSLCGETCVDLTSDDNNCGTCHTNCGMGTFCHRSSCVPICDPMGAPFGAGTGEEHDPYVICTAEQLTRISGDYLKDHFLLTESIDLTDLPGEFEPIASPDEPPFTGSFDGSDLEIKNISISTDQNNRALFGVVGTEGVLKNIIIKGGTVQGQERTGALAGINHGTIRNCHAQDVVVEGLRPTGGLVGRNDGDIHDSSATDVEVHGSQNNLGALVGANVGNISDSWASGTVHNTSTGSGDNPGFNTGGLVGRSEGEITNCTADVDVTGNKANVGGLAGLNTGKISNSSATGSVQSTDTNTGGLVGLSQGPAATCLIYRSFATGDASTNAAEPPGGKVGGLVGLVGGGCVVEESFATGNATASGNDNNQVGGLVGRLEVGTVKNSYATGNAAGGPEVGGLIGRTKGEKNVGQATVFHCYSTGKPTTSGDRGGLIGKSDRTTVTNSYWNRSTSGYSRSNSGRGSGLSAGDFAKEKSFKEWSFEHIWRMSDPAERPELQWE